MSNERVWAGDGRERGMVALVGRKGGRWVNQREGKLEPARMIYLFAFFTFFYPCALLPRALFSHAKKESTDHN
jgi:hypothetical protein